MFTILVILIFYCRTSLRLGNLFGMNQRYHQIALRLHPAGVVYLTVRYTQLSEAYNRYPKWNKIHWLNRLNDGGVEWNVNKIRTIRFCNFFVALPPSSMVQKLKIFAWVESGVRLCSIIPANLFYNCFQLENEIWLLSHFSNVFCHFMVHYTINAEPVISI